MFSRALFSPDPGRHLPSVSAAGALQLSGLSVWKGPVSLCAEAQTSQFAGGRASTRRPEVWGAELDCVGCVWG